MPSIKRHLKNPQCRRYLLNLAVLTLTSLALFLWNGRYDWLSFLRGRFIIGSNIYRAIDKLEFYETILSTFLLILLCSWRQLHYRFPKPIFIAFGFTGINFGLMLIDIRLNEFNEEINLMIQYHYLDTERVYALAILSLVLGIIIACLASMHPKRMHR